MSWKDYVSSLMSTNLLNSCAIVGANDGKIYASTDGFKLTVHPASSKNEKGEKKEFIVDEYHQLKELFPSGKNDKIPNSVYIDGKKYVVLEVDDGKAHLKCENGGATVHKTLKCYVIGTYTNHDDPKKTGGNCNSIIEEFGEQLIKANY